MNYKKTTSLALCFAFFSSVEAAQSQVAEWEKERDFLSTGTVLIQGVGLAQEPRTRIRFLKQFKHSADQFPESLVKAGTDNPTLGDFVTTIIEATERSLNKSQKALFQKPFAAMSILESSTTVTVDPKEPMSEEKSRVIDSVILLYFSTCAALCHPKVKERVADLNKKIEKYKTGPIKHNPLQQGKK